MMDSKQIIKYLGISIYAVIFSIAFELSAQNGAYPTDVLRLDPRMDNVVSTNAEVELISEGFNWTEGPLWVPEGQFLLFCDVPENKIFKWKEGEGTSLYLEPSGYTGTIVIKSGGAGGLLLDSEGKLLITQQGDRQLGRMNASVLRPRPDYATIVDKTGEYKFNSPNDLTIDNKGNIYFTDPPYGLYLGDKNPTKELNYSGIYRLSNQGQLTLISKKLKRPNGNGEVVNERMFFDGSNLI